MKMMCHYRIRSSQICCVGITDDQKHEDQMVFGGCTEFQLLQKFLGGTKMHACVLYHKPVLCYEMGQAG